MRAHPHQELCSWDLSKVPNIGTVLDAALFGKDELVCLSRPRTGGTKVLGQPFVLFEYAVASVDVARLQFLIAHPCPSGGQSF